MLDLAQAQSIAYVELVNGAVYVQDQDQVAGYIEQSTGCVRWRCRRRRPRT